MTGDGGSGIKDKDEPQERVREICIEGRFRMTKEDLIDVLRNHKILDKEER